MPEETSDQMSDQMSQDLTVASRRPRRTTLLSVVVLVVVAVLGGGAYAAYSFLDGGGPHPEDVLPASTVGVVSVDLDPSAGQKVSALRSMRKFPALKDALGMNADDDLRERAFEAILDQGHCRGLDFHDDIEPWLGKRAGFGAVDLGGSDPAPVIALQVTDPAKAKKEFAALLDCTDPEDIAFVVGDDYLIASDTADHARTIRDEGVRHPLADDAAYRKWTGDVGDAGVVSFYVSRRAAAYFGDLVDEFAPGSGMSADLAPGLARPGVSAGTAGPRADRTSPFSGFRGLAGTVRFADGGMELVVVTGGATDLTDGGKVGDRVARLPADTAVALGFGVPKSFASALVDQLGSVLADSPDDLVGQAEEETGLDLPEDLQTLLGDSLTLSLGGDVPDDLDAVEQPSEIPAGLLIHGDPDRIEGVITRLEEHLGTSLADIPLVLDKSEDAVVIATSRSYADELLRPGRLGTSDHYRSAVPEPEHASGVLYLDFDSRWRDAIADAVAGSDGDAAGRRFDANTEPLKSLGLSSWADDGVTHTVLKLATD